MKKTQEKKKSSKLIKSDILIEILPRLFMPVAALCLRNSLKYQEVLDALKLAFLEAAKESSSVPSSTSELSSISGLQRKDITRLSNINLKEDLDSSLLVKVLSVWQSNKSYLKNKKPVPLTYKSQDSEFAKLVYSVSKDLSHYAIKKELIRLGLAKEHNDELQLVSQIYLSNSDAKASLELLAEDSADIFKAVEYNMLESCNDHLNLHLKTSYDNIALDSLPQIKNWLLDEGSAFHHKLRNFLSKHDKDLNSKLRGKPGAGKVTLGSFSLVEGEEK